MIAHLVTMALLAMAACGGAQAQSYPNKPVTVVVPFTAGGATDILGRVAAEVLQNTYNQTFVVENRTGAGGVIGYSSVARAAPDGHTLLFAPTTAATSMSRTARAVPSRTWWRGMT